MDSRHAALTMDLERNIWIPRAAGGWGSCLNVVIWFSVFPPANNPCVRRRTPHVRVHPPAADVDSSNDWGIGRSWRAKTPAFLH